MTLRPEDPTVVMPGDSSGAGGGAAVESGPSIVDQKVVEAAIRRGLISAVQASDVLDSLSAAPPTGTFVPSSASGASALDSMVQRGLLTPQVAKDLEDEVKNDFVPGYRLLGEVGRGGMGVVYRALQKRLDRTVALKVVNPGASSDKDYLRRFDQEARALAKLNHPNIVQVYDCGETAGKVYLALEFIEGPDAFRELRTSGVFGEAQALRIAREAALGLSHALVAGIIHRDVKPANLMLVPRAKAPSARTSGAPDPAPDDRWVTKVTDLGLARRAERGQNEAESTKAGTILGSPAYMAPEQADGEQADFRSDIYALGATLYHLVTGNPPYHADSAIKVIVKKQTERLEDPRTVNPALSDGLVHVLDRCLARPREERYASYEALVEDIDRVLRGERPASPPVPEPVSSLRLGPPTGRFAPDGVKPAAPPPAAAAPTGGGGGGGSAALIVMGAVVVSGLVGIALVWKRTPNDLGVGQSTEVSSDPTASVSATLDALAALSPHDALEPKRLKEAMALVDAVPEARRGPLSLRLAGIVGKALDATAPERVAALEAALARADYAALAEGVAHDVEPYRLLAREVPARLRELEAVAARAAGAEGQAERAAWAAAQGATDPLGVIAALETFEQRFPWSPALADAKARLAEAVAKAPEVVLRAVPSGARLTLDGVELPAGDWKGRLTLGEHHVVAEAEGFFVRDSRFSVQGGAASTPLVVRLFPKPARSLIDDPARFRPVFSPGKQPHEQFPDRTGVWSVALDRGALVGEAATAGGWGTAARDVDELLKRIKQTEGPWQVSFEVVPPAGGRAEVRLLHDAEGNAVAVGAGKDQVYVVVRGPGGAEETIATAPLAPGGGPVYLSADWDGRVLLARRKKELIGSLRVPWTPGAPRVECAVQGQAPGEFRELNLRALMETGAR